MDNLLSGIGIFICVGAVILVILAVVGFRAVLSGRDRDRARTLEQPPHDDSNIDTTTGFGGVPTTGGAHVYNTDQDENLDHDHIPDDAERRRRHVDEDDIQP